MVLLSSLAYSAAGEVLNCNSYDVATHAAIELAADKFICVLDGMDDMQLPQWLPLGDAEKLIGERAQVHACCNLFYFKAAEVMCQGDYAIAWLSAVVCGLQAAAEADEDAANGACNVMRYTQKAVSGSINELEFDLDW